MRQDGKKRERRRSGGGGLGVRGGGGLGGSGGEMEIYLVMRIESLMIMTNGFNDTNTILVYLLSTYTCTYVNLSTYLSTVTPKWIPNFLQK